MKTISIFFGAFLFLFVGFSHVSAALDCEEDDRICLCEASWSKGFDVVTDHMIDEELSIFFTQNDVAPADMWSAYRGLSLKYRCYLGVVCEAVHVGEDEDFSDSLLSGKNALGGSIPGRFSACALDASNGDLFGEMEGGSEALADIQKSCRFSESSAKTLDDEESEEDIPPETRTDKMQLYQYCKYHQDLSEQVFNRTLQNSLWKDSNRKVIGNFSKKVFSFSQMVNQILESAEQFAVNTNAAFGRLCTLSNPDT